MIVAITLFIFALIIGVAVIGRVPATLHTPLMSGANSIHGVVLVGVIIIAAESNSTLGNILVFFAALLGTMNVVGGYVVTDRMLEMFRPKEEPAKVEEAPVLVTQEVGNSTGNLAGVQVTPEALEGSTVNLDTAQDDAAFDAEIEEILAQKAAASGVSGVSPEVKGVADVAISDASQGEDFPPKKTEDNSVIEIKVPVDIKDGGSK